MNTKIDNLRINVIEIFSLLQRHAKAITLIFILCTSTGVFVVTNVVKHKSIVTLRLTKSLDIHSISLFNQINTLLQALSTSHQNFQVNSDFVFDLFLTKIEEKVFLRDKEQKENNVQFYFDQAYNMPVLIAYSDTHSEALKLIQEVKSKTDETIHNDIFMLLDLEMKLQSNKINEHSDTIMTVSPDISFYTALFQNFIIAKTMNSSDEELSKLHDKFVELKTNYIKSFYQNLLERGQGNGRTFQAANIDYSYAVYSTNKKIRYLVFVGFLFLAGLLSSALIVVKEIKKDSDSA
jgi:hypothetical protein